MELSPKDNERLRQVLVAGVALGDTIDTVKYIRDPEGRARGYIYRLNRGADWLIGIYRNDERTEVAQISGGLNNDRDLELDTPNVDPGDIGTFEEVFGVDSESP